MKTKNKKSKKTPLACSGEISEKSENFVEDDIEAKLLLDQMGHEENRGEFKLNPITNRLAGELFDEARSEVVERVIRVRRISLPGGSERWKIFSDTKLVFTLEGAKLLKKEREYLRSQDGFNFLISQGKSEIKSFNQIKKALKEIKYVRKSI
jgi:hypothetical protein